MRRFVSFSRGFGLRCGWMRNRRTHDPDPRPILAPPASRSVQLEKLGRKSAAKAAESFARTNLCAGPAGSGWRFGQTGTSARARAQKRAHVAHAKSERPRLHRRANRAGLRSNLGDLLKTCGPSERRVTWGSGLPQRSPIWRRKGGDFLHNILIKLAIIDCGRLRAKSSDNYATSSGKRRLKPSL
jgi:hypothetical protein